LNKTQKLLGMGEKGLIFVVSAPAGTGKSTLVEMLLAEFPAAVAKSCSCTTRSPRSNEIAKNHYEFISVDEFERKIAADDFLEYAKVFGNYYGTEKNEVKRLQEQGKHVVLVIDTQGAMKVKSKIEGIFIFIRPPTFEELRKRLFKRRTEDEEKIQERLLWAKQEIAMAHHYDYQIVNDQLDIAYQVLRSIFIAEEHKGR
jgi:guanylate kinase